MLNMVNVHLVGLLDYIRIVIVTKLSLRMAAMPVSSFKMGS